MNSIKLTVNALLYMMHFSYAVFCIMAAPMVVLRVMPLFESVSVIIFHRKVA